MVKSLAKRLVKMAGLWLIAVTIQSNPEEVLIEILPLVCENLSLNGGSPKYKCN
jgi:hypothetical protein